MILKAILRGFELTSDFGLCVNLSKSKVIGINLKDEFILAVSTFLSCKIGYLPFGFLGVNAGPNSRRK